MTNKNKENGSLLKKLLWWIPIIILGLMFALGACTRQESKSISAESFSSAESTQSKSISDESTTKHSEEITGTQSQKKHKQKSLTFNFCIFVPIIGIGIISFAENCRTYSY